MTAPRRAGCRRPSSTPGRRSGSTTTASRSPRTTPSCPTLTVNYNLPSATLTSITGYYSYDYVSQGNADSTSYSYFWSYSDEKNSSFYQELRAVTAFDGMDQFRRRRPL